jgi:hypothetical protein
MGRFGGGGFGAGMSAMGGKQTLTPLESVAQR